MATRSYGQYCGLAMALDLLGQRWALLVVRDLAPGPRRFTDLFAGLPGIATDVLAERLRSLEEAGVVRQRTLSRPAPAKVYELTPSGRELAEIVVEMARWGQRLAPKPGSTDARVEARWAIQSMVAAYEGGLADGAYGLVVDGEELTVTVAGDVARLQYGMSDDGSLVAVLRTSTRSFFALTSDPSRAHRLPRGSTIDGDPADIEALLRALPLFAASPGRTGSGAAAQVRQPSRAPSAAGSPARR